MFWLDLLYDTKYIDEDKFKKLQNDTLQVYKIITKIIITKKQNINMSNGN